VCLGQLVVVAEPVGVLLSYWLDWLFVKAQTMGGLFVGLQLILGYIDLGVVAMWFDLICILS